MSCLYKVYYWTIMHFFCFSFKIQLYFSKDLEVDTVFSDFHKLIFLK